MIWRLLDNLLSRLVGRLLRLSPVDPKPRVQPKPWLSKPCNPGCDCSECYGR